MTKREKKYHYFTKPDIKVTSEDVRRCVEELIKNGCPKPHQVWAVNHNTFGGFAKAGNRITTVQPLQKSLTKICR